MRILSVLIAATLLQSCGQKDAPSATRSQPLTQPEPTAATAPRVVRDNTERLFHNPFDADAVYFLSQKNGTTQSMGVLIKRVSQDGTQYSRWVFNCEGRTAQNFGVAASVQALDNAANSMPAQAQTYEAKSRLGAIATTVCE